MLRLILMRHGEAVSAAATDHARPLTDRGRGEAARVGAELMSRDWAPVAVRGSDAVRTRQTWEALSTVLPTPSAGISWTNELYLPCLEDLVADAEGWPSVDTLLCLGHNPGWSESASRLSGLPVRLGTAFAAVLESEADTWDEAFHRRWELRVVLRP